MLGRHRAVRESLVLLQKSDRGEGMLVAYVAARAGDRPTGEELRRFLRERLPEHLVPPAFVVLDAFPVSATGKVDRSALPRAEVLGPAPDAVPRTDLERAIAEVWQEELALPRVGVDQSFFDLGGHSLLLVRVHRRLRDAVDPSLHLLDLFEHPTIGTLAAHVAAVGSPEAADRFGAAKELAERQRNAARRLLKARRDRGV